MFTNNLNACTQFMHTIIIVEGVNMFPPIVIHECSQCVPAITYMWLIDWSLKYMNVIPCFFQSILISIHLSSNKSKSKEIGMKSTNNGDSWTKL